MINFRAHRQVQGSGMIKAKSMIIKTKIKLDHTCRYIITPGIVPTRRMKDSVICCTDTYISKHAFHFAGILFKMCIKTVSEGTIELHVQFPKHPPHLFCPNREPCPIPEPDGHFGNRLYSSGT